MKSKLMVVLVLILLFSGVGSAITLTDEEIVAKAQEDINGIARMLQPGSRKMDLYFPYFPGITGDIDWKKSEINRIGSKVVLEVDITKNVLQTFVSNESYDMFIKTKDYRYVFNMVHYICEITQNEKNKSNCVGGIMIVIPSRESVDMGQLGLGCRNGKIEDRFSGDVLYVYTNGWFAFGCGYKDGKVVCKYENSDGKDQNKLKLKRYIGGVYVGENVNVECAMFAKNDCFSSRCTGTLQYARSEISANWVKYESNDGNKISDMKVYNTANRVSLFGTFAMETYYAKVLQMVRRNGLEPSAIDRIKSLKRGKCYCRIMLYYDCKRSLKKVVMTVTRDIENIFEKQIGGVDRLWKAICSVKLPALPRVNDNGDKYLYMVQLNLLAEDDNISDAEIEAALPVIVPVK